MQTLPISKVKDRLDELVRLASQTHERVTITKGGTPAAILLGMDDWEALQETLFWLGEDGNRGSIATAREELRSGEQVTEEQVRAEFGVPKRPA